MASETTFDHWKVFFSWGKVRKRARTFEALMARFCKFFWWSNIWCCKWKYLRTVRTIKFFLTGLRRAVWTYSESSTTYYWFKKWRTVWCPFKICWYILFLHCWLPINLTNSLRAQWGLLKNVHLDQPVPSLAFQRRHKSWDSSPTNWRAGHLAAVA